MYHVDLSQRADKFLNKLPQNISDRIKDRLKLLAGNPVPSDTKFMGRDEAGDKAFRYRIGNYRAIYTLQESQNIIIITKIDKRPRVYD